jgi:phosphatidylserine decarboxylase
MISPCDALISECSSIDDNLAMQIKGMSYNVDELLGDKISDEAKRAVHNGDYCNWYLSPKDYHRYHIPFDAQILQAVYIPGKLYPVNMPALKNVASLFVENERVVLECMANNKRFFMIMVGALNVGKMQISFAPQIQTNASVDEVQSYKFDNLHVKKGDDFGCFEMGSTIVMLSQKGLIEYELQVGLHVKYAQKIAKINS